MGQLSDRDLHAMFDNMLDECNPTVKIFGMTYEPSDVLKSTDPVAYRCMFADWLSDQLSDCILFEDSEENIYDDESLS